MHGLGNDFVIIDCRENDYEFSNNQIKLLGDRNLGIGFDQFVLMYKSDKDDVQTNLKFWNSDGSISSTCGNATRCVADIIMLDNFSNDQIVEGIKKINKSLSREKI